jgi:hypothetical protein
MYIWPGLVLLGCARGVSKKTCKNANDILQGVEYRVKEVSDTHGLRMATLWMTKAFGGPHDLDEGADGEPEEPWEIDPEPEAEETVPEDAKSTSGRPLKLEVPLQDIPLLFRLMHALCYYTSQGRTFRNQHVFLCDVHKMRDSYGKRALTVGLSRATHGACVHVVGDQYDFLRDLMIRVQQ